MLLSSVRFFFASLWVASSPGMLKDLSRKSYSSKLVVRHMPFVLALWVVAQQADSPSHVCCGLGGKAAKWIVRWSSSLVSS